VTPTIPDRIDSMIQTMADIVIPAIGADSSLARDQAQLVMAHLLLIKTQLPYADRFDADELSSAVELARKLIEIAKGGAETQDGAARLAQAVDGAEGVDPAVRHMAYRAVCAASEDLVRAGRLDGDAATVIETAAAVRDHARRKVERDRIWFRDSGFDAEKDSLPPLSSLFEPGGG
jgi:hypothetical protein